MGGTEDGGSGLRELRSLANAVGGLSSGVRYRLIDALLGHIDQAVVLCRVEDTSGEWNPVVAYTNPGFSEITGYAEAEVVGRPQELWAPLEVNRAVNDKFRRGLDTGQAARGDLRVRTKGGSTRWVDVSVSPVVEEHGVHYFVTTMHDVTERMQLLRDLVEQGEQLHEAQAIAEVGSWTWDVAADHVEWSDELYRIYGLDRDEFGASFAAYLDLVHPDDREIAREHVEESVRTHEPFVGDYRIRRADGEIRWIHSRGRALVDEPSTVVRLTGTCQDVTRQRLTEDRLRHQALHDELTGLPTRALLLDRLEHAMSRSSRHGLVLVLLFADLDDFKAVNDRYGHATGDDALTAIARHLRTALRPGDTVARFGGDEFVALCEEVEGERQAVNLGQRVVEAVRRAGAGLTIDLRLSASVGIVVSDGSTPAEVLLRDADAAMYRAKQRGRGRTELFS